jgi:hypothetical protein
MLGPRRRGPSVLLRAKSGAVSSGVTPDRAGHAPAALPWRGPTSPPGTMITSMPLPRMHRDRRAAPASMTSGPETRKRRLGGNTAE